MGAVVYRAAPPDALVSITLDILTAIFHRPSGTTHLVIAPAPEILAALAEAPLSADALLARLAADYDLGEIDALSERLAELIDAGLVEAVTR
ncbi:conserved hypothetical protein [Sphingomonas sp. EC-HK361]|uniref:HPr-rel-A system PqqD family peptide chaperone n=1 Tax=Sphingomonas sp. EC-HK361 TaxID=2038397 RepID=UPI0012576421|nr:HPr-rel-A system PqqD family peptide chaperone [Sphingomonas sp. EC-HK361]VVT14069.1 conserved hypothetical protein [Sphingomonas sp. EC-HK361]